MREYPMSLSRGTAVVSALGTLLTVGIPAFTWFTLSGGPGVVGAIVLVPTLLVPLVPVGAWALAPKAVALEGGELRVIRRAWRDAAWPLARVESVEILPPRALRGAIRSFGNGGLFGYYGWYYRKGAFRLFATRLDRLVELRIEGKRVVVSPDDPARFVEGLLAAAPRARLLQPGAGGAASARATS
jgi:hypothetical protein